MIIPIVIGAVFLGRAFDFHDFQTKPFYIFDHNSVKEHVEYEVHDKSEASYKVVGSTKEALNFLDIHPAMALKAMQGELGIYGIGGYLSQAVNRMNTVDILMMYKITKGVETFPSTVKQGKEWQKWPQRDVGTHYISGLEYGGQLFISVQFKPHTPEDVDDVRHIINTRLGQEGSLDTDFLQRLVDLTPLIADKAFLRLSVYSTTGSFSAPTTMADLKKLVEEFPEMVKRVNHGKGAPLRIMLEDLHTVQANFTKFIISREVLDLSEDIEDKYDDLRIAFQEFRKWEGRGEIWTADQEKLIDDYQRHLKRAYQAMQIAIRRLDITGSASQFDNALEKYDYDGEEKYYRYSKELQELIDSLAGYSLFRTIYSSLLAIQEESRSY